MTYKGNQIKSITDAYTSQGQYLVKEYLDKAGNSLNEMSYDANGNMTKNLDSDIVTIRYNGLNLPDNIIQSAYGIYGMPIPVMMSGTYAFPVQNVEWSVTNATNQKVII